MVAATLDRRGFTLIELLLAVVLSAMMIGVVMGTYLGIRNGVSEGLVRNEAEMEGALLSKRVMLDLESAYLGNPLLPDRFYFEGKVSETPWQTTRLSFVSAVAGDGEEGDVMADLGRVTYRLVPSKKGDGAFHLYRDLTPLMSNAPVKKELISDRVVSFRVVFMDRNHKVNRYWDSRALQWKDRLPYLIRVELSVSDMSGNRHTFRVQAHPEQDWWQE